MSISRGEYRREYLDRKLTSKEEDISPIIRLVDTTIFTALERRASNIHIMETYDVR